jgi:putative tributyrin esterase
MACARIEYYSQSLCKASTMNVLFPDDPKISPPWSVFYLLHGLFDNETTWTRRTSIERYVEGLPLMVVMPDGGRGWFTNALNPETCRYEDDLIKDVVGLIDRTFPVKAERAGRAIGGLSMGGYGAVKLALKYPDMFASVTSHSGVLAYPRKDRAEAAELSPEFLSIFGENAKDGPEDPFALVAGLKPKRVPAMRLDCGEEDVFLEDNREFHKLLDSLSITHEFEEFEGGHDWAYWDTHVQEAVAFHARTLKLG